MCLVGLPLGTYMYMLWEHTYRDICALAFAVYMYRGGYMSFRTDLLNDSVSLTLFSICYTICNYADLEA